MAAIEYGKTIDDFDDLIDPHTLALHCLGPKPSAFVLRTLEIEEKKSEYSFGSSPFFFFNKCFPLVEMTTKFNQGMYTRMRAKKNDPLSNLGTRTVHIVEKGVFVTPATPDTEMMRTASPAASIEEITPLWKKQRVADKGKDKADSRLSSVWDNAGLALARAQDTFTAEELKVFSNMSLNEIVGRHLHKLVQVEYLCKFNLLLSLVPLFRCWGRVFISPQSTLLRRRRLRLRCLGWRIWRQRTLN